MVIKPLDFVKTPAGNVALVTEIDESGNCCISFIGAQIKIEGKFQEKNAWWTKDMSYMETQYGYHVPDYEGLVVIESLPRLLALKMAHPFGNGKKAVDEYYPSVNAVSPYVITLAQEIKPEHGDI